MNFTKTTPNILESKAIIRFQHCDPFNHLNNAEYLNYLVNAREDQLIEYYDIDIYEMGRSEGKSWVVASNQIAYLRPAFAMEEVVIQSQLLGFDDTSLKVELRMYNRDRTKVKAVMWSNYVHFNLIEQKREKQQAEMLALFTEVAAPVDEKHFEERVAHWKAFNSRGSGL